MGNEQCRLPGIEIEDKAIDVSDYWTQHNAHILNSGNITNVSVFLGDSYISGSLWTVQTPLEKNIKNLMIYRHPCILKYISSWQEQSKYFLVVEEVIPLSHVISRLSVLQISVGLHSILRALYFLHYNALTTHNNICTNSIYVTKDGKWKLGGMEYLCKYKDLSYDYLNNIRTYRWSQAIDENEDKLLQSKVERKDFIDIYAFGILAYDILRNKSDEELSSLSEFSKYCKNDMQHVDLSQRPTFKDVINHTFFDQDFVTIHSFLIELPLKTECEKTDFFQHLSEKLINFDEVLVASQLGELLLSRLVLLNHTAQRTLLPIILRARNVTEEDDSSSTLFSENTFKKYLCPKLLDIFKVRDVHIRLVLLEHFPNFMRNFTKDELQNFLLPELLVGIKDTNDTLVSVTLRTLADLVPLLGASTVIGGKRAKLFNDGWPAQSVRRLSKNKKNDAIDPLLSLDSAEIEHLDSSTTGLDMINVNKLPERPRPDGEEVSTDEVDRSVDEDIENWEDWDTNGTYQNNQNILNFNVNSSKLENIYNVAIEKPETEELPNVNTKSKVIPDILELDIKNQLDKKNDDIDFFEDMEPQIDTTNKYVISEVKGESIYEKAVNKLALTADDAPEEGWEDEDWE